MECRLLASASTWYFLSEKKDVLPQLLEPNRAGRRSLYVDSQMAWQRLSHCKREALTGVSCTLTEKEDGGRQEGRRRADEAFPYTSHSYEASQDPLNEMESFKAVSWLANEDEPIP
ncbi:hypothetical protein SELMODRAFT_411566 [Selaginella moellendorffii]|uniref:Uncharacterized protein n=1 Tax=Selaginella moellendorffii TaxID=88036 RepID=D8RIC3_SELML|nr:hypothetical protein SELMODRAFT_411566 [Selaginella moellendorffii]